jgi:putative acetyltransferase
MEVIIRDERTQDLESIEEMSRQAFGEEEEGILVNKLRANKDAMIFLVAEKETKVVGYILLSRMYVKTNAERIPFLGLAPVAVLPSVQNQGIGSRLIEAAIQRAKEIGESAIILLGHKEYYPRFGFSSELMAYIQSPFNQEAFMGLELKEGALKKLVGIVQYPEAFGLVAE